jgi:hypothetical protein
MEISNTKPASLRSILSEPISPGVTWVLAAIAFSVLGERIQAAVLLNHDISWIVHSSRWLLRGAEFGLDVIDPNPPLAWWLSMPAAFLAEHGLASEPTAIRAVFWAYFLGTFALFVRVTSQFAPAHRSTAVGWQIGFLVMLALAPAASFGQREYLSVLFAMPYLATVSLRLERQPVRLSVAVVVGILAGIGFGFKPYLLAVPLLLEIYLVARTEVRSILRAESLAMGTTLACYAGLVLLLCPQYFSHAIPLMRAIYWAFDSNNPSILVSRYLSVAQPLLFAALAGVLARTWAPQLTVLAIACLGYSASYFIQSKGFVYHGFPVLACAAMLAIAAVATGLSRVRSDLEQKQASVWGRSLLVVLPLLLAKPALAVHAGVASWFAQYNTTWGQVGVNRTSLIDLVNHHAAGEGKYFYAFSMHLFPGFPTASYTTAEWSGRSATQAILSAYARRDELVSEHDRRRVEAAAQLQRQMVIEDFVERPPEVVLMETMRSRFGMNGRTFDDVEFYLAAPEFKSIWDGYVEAPAIGPYRVFVRRADHPAG